jgi:PIN domain nuclease of toxin-antitoxin system
VTGLLDTHTLLWSVYYPAKLSRRAAAIVRDPANVILVSAASAWEIATKVRLGRLPQAAKLEQNFVEAMRVAGFALRPITVEDGLRAGRMAGEHQDPFDRMLVAQALADDIPLISNDVKLDEFGVRRIW